MKPFITKVRRGNGFFRLFDQKGTYIEVTPEQFYEAIAAGWLALDKPNWNEHKE